MASASELAACAAAVDRVREAAELAERAAGTDAVGWFRDTIFSREAWAQIIGAESARDAVRADAAATRLGFETMRDKLDRWRRDPEPVTSAMVVDFLRACGSFADVRAIVEVADLLSPGTAATTVGVDTAHDLVRDVAAGATLGLVGWAAFAVLGACGAAILGWFMRRVTR